MKVSSFIMLTLCIIAIFGIVAGVIGNLNTYYPTTQINRDSMEKYQTKYTEIESEGNRIANKTKSLSNEGIIGVFSGIFVLLDAVVIAGKSVFTSYSIMELMMSDVATYFGIPGWLISIAIVALLIGVVFAVLSLWHRWRA